MELYEYAQPEVMAGKKILYLHGFASSGQSGSVRTLRLLLPQTEIIAPDIPEKPQEALRPGAAGPRDRDLDGRHVRRTPEGI